MVGPSGSRSSGAVSGSSAPPRPSRASVLAARLAAQAAGAAQARLDVSVRGGRHLTRRPAHTLAAPFPPLQPQAPAPAPPSTASGARGSRPPSASSLQPAPLLPPQPQVPQTLSTAVSFRHLDDARTWVESDACAGANPEWNVSSEVALNVTPALLARMEARPFRIQVREVWSSNETAMAFHAAQAQAHAALHVAPASPATSPRGKSPRGSIISSSTGTKSPRGGVETQLAVAAASAAAGVSMVPALSSLDLDSFSTEDLVGEERRPGIPLGEVVVSLAPLLHGADSIEGWFTLEAPASLAPSPAFFAPDHDLGLPEAFIPFAMHQSQQQPQQQTPSASQQAAQGAGRPSAPSTPEKGAKRSTSSGRDSKRDTANAASEPDASVAAPAAAPAAPTPPMEVFVSIKLSRALLSAAEAAASTVLHLDVERLSSLPARWLADVNELDAEKARTRAEAEAHIAAWRKKGSKKAAPPPPPAAAKSSSSSSAGVGGAGGSGGGKTAPASAGAKKTSDKERAREAELRALGERLNSFYRFGYAIQVPLTSAQGDAPFVVAASCDRLELPPEPPQTPSQAGGAGSAGEEPPSTSLELGSGSTSGGGGRRSVAPTPLGSPTNASKSLASGGGAGGAGAGGASTGAGAATGTSKGRAKKELEERLAREMAEAAEAAHALMQQRLAGRFVPFDSRHSVFLTGEGVASLRSLTERGGSLPLTLWRELVSLDPSTPGLVLSRDEVSGSASLDLRPLLKPASTNLAAELAVKISPEVVAAQQAEAERVERERAAQAAAVAAGDVSAADEGATTAASSPSDDKSSRRASALQSSSGGGASAGAASGASKKSARKTGGAGGAGGKDDAAASASSSSLAGGSSSFAAMFAGDPFTAARTTLSMRVTLSRPLVALVVKPLLSLGEVVPPRKMVPPPRASPAVALSEELAAFLAQLSVEYKALLAQAAAEQEENGPLSPEELEASLAASLLYRLNSSGMYHALKERLKPPMMQLAAAARRALPKPEAASQETTFEQRCSALYADMLDRMHLTLNELFHPSAHAAPTTLSPPPSLPPPLAIVPDAPYEQQVHVGAPATIRTSPTRARVQADMASEGPHASSRLAVMAQEAELQNDFPRAALLHHTRCLLEYRREVSASETAGYWYDFACFQLRLQHPQAAHQALRHALSIDPTHETSMLALAAWSLELRRDLDAAEVLLRTYQQRRDGQEVALQYFVLRGVYAEMIDEPEQAAEAFARAAELAPNGAGGGAGGLLGGVIDGITSLPSSPIASAASHALAGETAAAMSIPGTQAPALIALPDDFKFAPTKGAAPVTAPGGDNNNGVAGPDSVWMRGTRYFLALCLPGLAAHVLGKEARSSASSASSPLFHEHLARLALVRLGCSPIDTPVELHCAEEASAHIQRAQTAALDHGQVVDTFAMQGHIFYQQGRWDEAMQAYQVYQDWEPSTLDPLLLYRLGSLYTRQGEWAAAREVFLQLCSCAPSCSSWLGVARCALQLTETEGGGGDSDVADAQAEAEAALVQANLLDKSHAGVWARLSLVSLRNNRVQLAHQSLLHALRLELAPDESTLLVQIAALYAENGFVDLAISTLERALALQDSAAVRLQLARTLLLHQRFEHAEQHLQHAVAIAQDDETRADAHRQWIDVQKQLGRIQTGGDEQHRQQQDEQQQQQQHQQQRQEQEYENEQAFGTPIVAI